MALTAPLTLDDLGPMDYRYATGASRFAFAHAGHAVEFAAAGDKKMAAYHKREVVEHAKFLEEGLARIANSLGA